MSDQRKPAGAIGQAMPFVTAGLLIASFLWRTLTAAHEYPMRSEQVMTMLIDLGLIAGLYGMRQRLPAALFWIALVCGIGLFLIRLNSDASWWTGHLAYSILPR
jgi:MFS-type transporter involved in bile tolerance (Atg22 family)